jgi:hypothetical protein
MVKVSPQWLRAAAHECRVGAGQLAIAAECHREASPWEFAERSILASVAVRHEVLAESIQRRLDKTSTLLSSSALALIEAARKYEAGNVEAAHLLSSEAGS